MSSAFPAATALPCRFDGGGLKRRGKCRRRRLGGRGRRRQWDGGFVCEDEEWAADAHAESGRRKRNRLHGARSTYSPPLTCRNRERMHSGALSQSQANAAQIWRTSSTSPIRRRKTEAHPHRRRSFRLPRGRADCFSAPPPASSSNDPSQRSTRRELHATRALTASGEQQASSLC